MPLTKEDLQAIREIMKDEITESESRMRKEISTTVAQQLGVMQESYFAPQFKLMTEELSLIRETMATKEDIRRIEEMLEVHAEVLKQHSRDIAELKKAI